MIFRIVKVNAKIIRRGEKPMAVGNGEMAGPVDFIADLVEPLGVKLLT